MLQVHSEHRARSMGVFRRVWFDVKEVVGVMRLVARLHLEGEAGAVIRGTRRGGGAMMDKGLQDTRFALRSLRRNPGYGAAAILVLALGIGASTAIFSAANAYFYRPLPFGQEDRLVALYETNPEFGWTHEMATSSAPANVLDWRERVDAFSDIAMHSDFTTRITHFREGEPELLGMIQVTGNFFDVLEVRPAAGRAFTWEETWAGAGSVVVLSHGLWVSHFGADPEVIGRTLEFAGGTAEVVGVAPAGFHFPRDDVQLWTTFQWTPETRAAVSFRRAHFVRPIARLAPGMTLDDANAQLQTVVERLKLEYPETNRVMGAGFVPLRDFLIRRVRTPLLLSMGAVTLLLLLACTNVANLALVRASDRHREVALRFALGARRSRVARQMLTESLVLALIGGVAGLVLGWFGALAFLADASVGIAGATAMVLDHRVVLFALGATGLAGLLFGIAPTLRSAAGDVHESLKDGGRGGSEGRRGLRTAGLLVAVEVALALLLVVGAGLMVRSSLQLRQVDPGFEKDGVLAVTLGLPADRYPNRDMVLSFWDEFSMRLEARPGIERVGTVGRLPLAGRSWSSSFQAEGWPEDRVGVEILHRRADRGYFETLGVPLVAGRLFGPSDEPDGPLVVVINETFAREHFPGEDPIGQRIAYDAQATPESIWYEIVGVVGDQHQVSPGVPARAEVFENRDQDWGRNVWVVMRTTTDPLAAVPVVRGTLQGMDALIPLAEVRPLDDVWSASMETESFVLTILAVFGTVALLLAAVGVYGVTAQAARKRTQEIGIRMALGAGSGQVVSMILRQGLAVVALGLVAGTATSLLATRALATVLFGVEPSDPLTLVAVVALLGGVAAVACYLPARRATAADPVSSLRAE